MKKILFISTIFPTDLGGMRRVYYHLLYFSKSFEVHFLFLNLDGHPTVSNFDIPKNIRFVTFIWNGKKVFDRSFIYYPIYVDYMSKSASFLDQVQIYIDKEKIDVICIHTFTLSLALRNLKAALKVADVIDSPKLYYKTKYHYLKSPSSFALFQLNCFLSSFADRKIGQSYDVVSYISESDSNASCTPKSKSFVFLEPRDPPGQKKNLGIRETDVVLFARWSHPPNRDGLKKIWADLGLIKGKVKVIGPDFPDILLDSKPCNVEVLNYVQNIGEILSKTKFSIVPVWYGAGVQNKVFDSLKNGCLVISTQFTASTFKESSFPVRSIIVTENFASKVNLLLGTYDSSCANAAYFDYEKMYQICLEGELNFVKTISEKLDNEPGK